MTTVASASNAEVTTPTSYVSRWIAQTHGAYSKNGKEFYSLSSPSSTASSCDYQTPTAPSKQSSILITPTTTPIKSSITTWQAQARSRLQTANTAPAAHSPGSNASNNNELQEKLNCVRALLDAKKRRSYRQCSSSSSTSSSTVPDHALTTSNKRDSLSVSSPPPSSSFFPAENVFYSHDEHLSSANLTHHSSSLLPCLMEESPSDSGCSDGTKATHHEDIIDASIKNPAMIDLSKPLSKEEMLAIIQILRELWKKQFGTEIPDTPVQSALPVSHSPSLQRLPGSYSNILNNKKSHYHSTPALNKLSAELNDIKDKLKRFSNGRTTNEQVTQRQEEVLATKKAHESQPSPIRGDHLVFIPLGAPITSSDLERMQMKKDLLIRRQIQRREEQLIKKNERLMAATEHQTDYRLYEDYVAQRRQEDDLRRKTILCAHVEQKRFEAHPPSSHDYYFDAARTRHRLKRKASMTSFVSFDDRASFGGSTFDLFSSASGKKSMHTPKRSSTGFDFLSPSVTASTAASRSKMNRAASICNINEHYDSFTSLNSKATMPIIRTTRPAALFGGSLMNINLLNKTPTQQQRSSLLMDDPFESPLTGSFSSLAFSSPSKSRLARSHTHLSTKSNKQPILNALKQVVLAGPANEQQRQIVAREIELSDARHFVVLFRDHRLQFRAIYMYIPETDIIEKVHGVGPHIITEVMVDKWFKYNSGSKRFTNIPIRHFSIQCDAIIIHNEFWQKKLLVHMNQLH